MIKTCLAAIFLLCFGALTLGSWIQSEKNAWRTACAGVAQENCWKKHVLGEIARDGLPAGYRLIGQLYEAEPSFRPGCFSFTLKLGAEVYAQFPDYTALAISPETTWCNYGFYHEYPRALLLATKDTSQARAFCLSVGNTLRESVPGAEMECFRGIGRGLPFIAGTENLSHMAAYAVEKCKELAPSALDRGTCLSGAFNLLARKHIANKDSLFVEANDPMGLCAEQTDSEAQVHCYSNSHSAVLSLLDLSDMKGAMQKLQTMYGSSTTTRKVIWAIGYDSGRESVGTDSGAPLRRCGAVPSEYQSWCIEGVSVGLAKNGTPGHQEEQVLDFCTKARDALPQTGARCPSLQAIEYLGGFYGKEGYERMCAKLQSSLGVSCPPFGEFKSLKI